MSVVLTCRGLAKYFGVKKEKDLAVVVDSYCSVSKEFYAVFLKKNSSAKEIIKNSGCFAVNFVSEKILSSLSREFDEFDKIECEKIDCPHLKFADSFLECEIKHELDLGNHVLFVGSVLLDG